MDRHLQIFKCEDESEWVGTVSLAGLLSVPVERITTETVRKNWSFFEGEYRIFTNTGRPEMALKTMGVLKVCFMIRNTPAINLFWEITEFWTKNHEAFPSEIDKELTQAMARGLLSQE